MMTKPKSGPQTRKQEITQDNAGLNEVLQVSQTAQPTFDDNPKETQSFLKNDLGSEEKIKIEEPSARIEALNDKYLRLMAEFDNYKRRSAKEHERLIEAANELLIKDIIEVRENFERAFKSHDQGDTFVDGMKLNYAKLNAILQKHGLEVYGEPGDEFSPELHEAIMSAPHASIPDSHISNVLERGYKLKGKIIKHAKVVVSSGSRVSRLFGP